MPHRSKQLFYINCLLFVVLCVEMFSSTTKQAKLLLIKWQLIKPSEVEGSN